jgi:hypothetical protein
MQVHPSYVPCTFRKLVKCERLIQVVYQHLESCMKSTKQYSSQNIFACDFAPVCLWQKNCLCFSLWTKAKWVSGWWNNLVHEELQGFGLVESVKTMDNWSSWSFEGACIFVLLAFYFFHCLFFVGDELCFAFFMDWAALGVDPLGVLWCLWMPCIMKDGGW